MNSKLLTTLLISTILATAMPAADAQLYPLKTCVVSGEPLGTMGKPVHVSHDGTTVQLCCKSCLKDFNKEPAKYVKMVKDASAKP